MILPEYHVFIWPKADYVVNCKRLNFVFLKLPQAVDVYATMSLKHQGLNCR